MEILNKNGMILMDYRREFKRHYADSVDEALKDAILTLYKEGQIPEKLFRIILDDNIDDSVVYTYLLSRREFTKSSMELNSEFNEVRDAREKVIVERLIDIRRAETEYRNIKGDFTTSFDTLINFVKYEKAKIVLKEGELTDKQLEEGLSEREAVKQGLIKRDTTYVSMLENLFGANYPVDSLRYIPFSSPRQEFTLEKAEINKQYALYTIAYMQERLNNELEKKYKLLQEKYEDTCRELSNRQQENSSNKSAAYQDLIDYLNMPVPYNWKTFTVQERLRYIHDKSIWQGSPREFICTPEVSCEFYGYKREELNVRTGRIVSNAIRGTGLFVQDGTKKSFVHYGSNKAWIRKSK